MNNLINGFPLSAIVGKREIMLEMEKVFLSGTFGGELLSLTAAKNVLNRHISEDICLDLHKKGLLLEDLTQKAIQENNLENILNLSGHPTWKFLNWQHTLKYSKEEIKTYFLQEIFQEGVLVLNTHNITQSHSKKIIARITNSYFNVFKKLKKVLDEENLKDELKVPPLIPLFSVR